MTNIAMRSKKARYVTVSGGKLADSASDFWSPFLPDGTDDAAKPFIDTVVAWDGNNSATGSAYGFRSIRFSAVQEALANMGKLPSGHDFHVDEDITRRASDLIAVIAENFEVVPPKLFPQDGEAVVFTWDYGPVKRYLTVDDEDVSVMDLHKGTHFRCHHDVQEDGDAYYSALVKLIGASPLAHSVPDDNV